jgi:hypothetical protein
MKYAQLPVPGATVADGPAGPAVVAAGPAPARKMCVMFITIN